MNAIIRSVVYLLTPALLALTPDMRAQTTSAVTTLHSFTGGGSGKDGYDPRAGLVQDNDNNFYGTTYYGGSGGRGTVFRMTPAGVLTTLHNFTGVGNDGDRPRADLIKATDGNFYGTTEQGGSTGYYGAVFRLTPAGGYTTVYSLNTGGSGTFTEGGLIQGSDGNFYGTTQSGGIYAYGGTAFRLTPTGEYTTLHYFADESLPDAGLIQGSDGDFYGTTARGGSSSKGTVFRITPAGGYAALHSFTGSGTDGENPLASLIQGSDGNFYGTTAEGGSSGKGTVFRITPAGKYTTLHSFTGSGTDGENPLARLTQGSDGNFYGTTNGGGSEKDGTVFRMTPAGVLTTLYSFTGSGTDGRAPAADLIEGSDGNFYGTTEEGGSDSDGTVFKLVLLPIITSPESTTGAVGRAFSYQITATDSPTSFSVQGLPAGLTLDAQTGLISGTPKTENAFNTTLHVTNAHGTSTAPLRLIIRGPLVITSAAAASTAEGEAFSYQITANEGVTTYSARGLPTGLSIDTTTGVITGTPFNSGTAAVEISVGNASATAFSRLTLSIKPSAPVFTSPNTTTATQDQAFSYRLTATNAPASYAARGLPTGLTLDTKKGYITGQPFNSGVAAVQVSATNAAGTTLMRLTFTIASYLPVVTSATTASATQGQAFSYQITATNSPRYYIATGLPTGLSLDPYTGLITGQPQNAGTAAVTINVYNQAGTGTGRLTLTITAD